MTQSNINLRCPNCFCKPLIVHNSGANCTACDSIYTLFKERLVLLSSRNELFDPTDYRNNETNNFYFRIRNIVSLLSKSLPGLSVNLSSARNLSYLNQRLNKTDRVLVLGSGKQRNYIESKLPEVLKSNIICIDIDKNADVNYFCDATNLPFVDGEFACVITTAVLQHISDNGLVVSEIERVLKNEGFIYSEYAFLQQVIEGGYDFTRLTMSGHRILYNRFVELDVGIVAGPATVFLWA